jgi:hypothetical protein
MFSTRLFSGWIEEEVGACAENIWFVPIVVLWDLYTYTSKMSAVVAEQLSLPLAFDLLVKKTNHKVLVKLHQWADEVVAGADEGKADDATQEGDGEREAREWWQRLGEDQHHEVEHELCAHVREEVFFWNLPDLGAIGDAEGEEDETNPIDVKFCVEMNGYPAPNDSTDAPFSVHEDVREVMESGGALSERLLAKIDALAEHCCDEDSITDACRLVAGQEFFSKTQCFSTEVEHIAWKNMQELKKTSTLRMTKENLAAEEARVTEEMLEEYEKYVQQNQDLVTWNNPNCDGYTPLHIAAANGDDATMKVLIKYVDDPFIDNDFGETPLHLAAMTKEKGRAAVIDLLMTFVKAKESEQDPRAYFHAIKRRTFPRLDHSKHEKDNGDGRLIKDLAGDVKPLGSAFINQNINGGKTANGIAKHEKNFEVVRQFNMYRMQDTDFREEEIGNEVAKHIFCSAKQRAKLFNAACDFS